MGLTLEFREHRLAIDRATQVVDLAIENIGPHLGVGCFLEQMFREKDLIER